MANGPLNKILFYGCADALNMRLYVNKNKVTGEKLTPIGIGNGVMYDMPMEVKEATYGGDVVAIAAQGPGNMLFVVFSEYQGVEPTTHVFICDKAKLSPVTALPDNPLSLTLQNLKAIYGPSVALYCHRVNNGATPEGWTVGTI